jgi:hypothetical protein
MPFKPKICERDALTPAFSTSLGISDIDQQIAVFVIGGQRAIGHPL